MRLGKLLEGIEVVAQSVPPDTEITCLCEDSRTAERGSLFAAVAGTDCDGIAFAKQAVERGAVCVLCREAPEGLPCVQVRDVRSALAKLACTFYDQPARKLTVLGVTGTNGKTTVTYLLRHILQATDRKTGLIGTVQNLVGSHALPAHRTTPSAPQLQSLLHQMLQEGCTHAVMEVSSHALTQSRVEGIEFACGIFTNLTEDHLDYHGTMERYGAAKAKLFHQSRAAVCNGDDPWTERLLTEVSCPSVRYGINRPADLWAEDIVLRATGVDFSVCTERERAPVHLGVAGRFSVYNALAAIAACGQLGISATDCAAALQSFSGVKGRMETVPTPHKPYTILIDYAHTPDALKNVLQTVRGFAEHRILVVFGCGGDREREKRPLMGRIAAELADYVVVTNDNPRFEEPMAIIRDIVSGMAGAEGRYEIEPDRRAAIALAMDRAGEGDILVLCGKGHEVYQEIGGKMLPLDEREIVRSLL